MARFQLFDNLNGEGFLLDVQSDFLDIAHTRVVVPLLPAGAVPPALPRLHPVFQVEGRSHVMATHLIAAVPVEVLARPRGDLAAQRDAITAALDMLFYGF
jgi:toxin CcdB